jgi:type I restriction enzyme S subunit
LAEAKINIIDGDRGTNYPKQDDFYEDGFCLFLTAKNVSKSGFRFDETQYISEERDGLLRKGKLVRNDIVITTRGTVGNIAWYNANVKLENIRINSGMALIRKSFENVDSMFLYLLFRSHLVQKQIKLIAFGSAQPQLTIKEIKKFRIVLPPLQEQKQIATILSTVDDKLDILTQKKSHYQTLKKGLSQQLLTGQMRVKV